MEDADDSLRRNDTVPLDDEDAVKQVLVESVLGLWDVVNNLTRLTPTKHDRYRVTIFGSARTRPGAPGYDETKRVAAALAEMGCTVVTGGGPGLMQAANEGAASVAGEDRSVGIRVELPFEQSVNPYVGTGFEHRTFFTRLHHFVLASDAFVVAPGGIGTVLETMMVWQLLQVRHVREAPLILVGKMWPGLVAWAREAMLATDPPLANPEDFELAQCVATPDDAIVLLGEHVARWRGARGD
jgi:uncharacterized protein (TIGR00730 family)